MPNHLRFYQYLIASLITSSLSAATWNVNASGNWATNANWTSPATNPDAIDAVAQFLNAIAAPRTVTINATTKTIGTANFDNSPAYTIASNTLVFDVTAGTAALNITSVNGASAHIISSAVTLNDTLVVTHSTTSDFTMSGAIGGTGGLTKAGAGNGALVLSGATANTYSGTTTLSAGILVFNKTSGVNAVAGDITVNGGTLFLGATNQIANTSNMTLSGGLFNMNASTETISSLTFQSGTLSQGGAALTLANATTALTMRNVTISGPITLSSTGSIVFDSTNNGTATISGALNLGGATTTFNIANGTATNDMTISSIISNGAVTKTGAGTLQFSGSSANTFSGTTTVTAGTLSLNKTAGTNAIAGNVTINGGTLSLAAANQIINTSVVTISSGTFDMGSNAETIASLFFSGGTLTQGTATLTLADATNALVMINVTVSGAIALTSTGLIGFDSANNGTATLDSSSTLNLGGATTSFQIQNGTATTDMSISGVISNGGVTKTGAGVLEFAGSSANTYSGTTTVTAGTLSLNKTAGTNAIAGNVTVNGGTLSLAAANQIINSSAMTISSGTFDMAGFAETIDSLTYQAGTLTQGGATLTLANATTALTMRDTTISGAITLSGSGSVVFDNTNNNTATLSGTVDLGGGTVTFNIANGTAGTDMNVSGVLSNGSLTKTGAGTLQFSGAGANTYSGTTTVSAGTLSLNKTAGTDAIAGNVTVSGGTLSLAAANQIINSSAMTISSGTFDMAGFAETIDSLTFQAGTLAQGGATLTLTNATTALTMRDTTISGPITLSGSGSVVFDSTNNNTATISGAVDLGSGTVTFNVANGTAATDMTVSGVISNGGLLKSGAGTLQFSGSGANTYSGTTTVSAGTLSLNKTAGTNAIGGNVTINGGTLSLAAANQIINTSAMTLSSGTFDMGGNAETIGSLTYQAGTFTQGGATLTLSDATTALTMRDTTISGALVISGGGSVVFDNTNNNTATLSGTVDLGGGTSTFNIADGTAATDMDISGVISNGGVTKTGAGRLAFSGSGANTYSGTTTVTVGELFLNKTAGTNAIAGNITVNGGTLTLNAANQISDSSAFTLSSGTFAMGGNAEIIDSFTYQGGTFTQGGATLTLANATTALTMRDTTISGALVLSGSGAVVFDSTNNGTATISGTLDLGGSPVGFIIANGTASTDMNVSGVISNGGVTKSGAGRLEFSGASANTYIGTTVVSAGSLFLNKTAGVNSIAGDTLVNGGTLTLGAANQISNSANVSLSAGTFDMNGNAETVGSFTFQGGTFTQGGATLTMASPTTALTMRNTTISGALVLSTSGAVVFDSTNNGTATISGTLNLGGSVAMFDINDGAASTDMNISGVISNGGVNKISAGTLEFSGASPNTYTGLTTVSAGSLLLNKSTDVTSVPGDATISGGTLTLGSAGQIADTSNVTLSSGTFDLGGFNETISSFTFQGGTFTQGSANLTLTSASTALTMRNTTIAGPVLLTGGGSVVFDNTNNGTATLSDTLDLGGFTTTFTIADGTASTDMNVSGVIANGAVTKSGAGRLAFAGGSANTYTGLTTVSVGELFLNKTAGVNAIPGNVTVSGGTLTLNAANQIVNTAVMTISSGTFAMGANNETIDSLTFQSGSLTQSGGILTLANATTALTMRNTTIAGALVLSGSGSLVFDNTNNGTATLSSTLDLGGGTVSMNIADGTASSDMTISGVISNGTLTKVGAGLLEFSGSSANTYSGLTTVSVGSLLLNKSAGTNAIAGNVTVSGGTLTLGAANQIANTSAMTISSGTFDMGGNAETLDSLTYQGGTMTQSGAVLTLANATTALTMRDTTIPGALVLSGSGSVVFDATNNNTAILSGTVDLGGGAVSFNIGNGTASTDMNVSGVLSNGGLTKIGAGTLQFSGSSANTDTGLTTVSVGTLLLNKTAGVNAIAGNVTVSGGTLLMGAANQIIDTSVLTLSSGTFDMAGFNETVGSFSFLGGTFTQGGGILTLAGGGTVLTMRDTTISGPLVLGPGSTVIFDATNNGTAVISGSLDMSGGTTTFDVQDGTAAIDMNLSGVVSNGSIIKIGAGQLAMSGSSANTYAGLTTITAGGFLLQKTAGINAIIGDVLVNGGTLTLGVADQIADSSNITLSTGTFDMGGFDESISSFTFQGGTFSQGAAVLTLANATTALTMRNTTIAGAVVLSGGGAVVFDLANDGTATLSGTLDMGGNITTFNIADGAATTDMNVSGTISNGGVTKIGSGRLSFAGAGANTYSSLTTVTAGELFLNKTAGTNAIAGNVLVSGGTLTLNAANQIINSSAMTITSGTFAMGANNETIDNLTYQGGTLSQSGGVLTLGNATTALTMRDTTISGAVVLSGSGSVVFDSTNNGTATLASTLALGGGTVTFNIGNGTATNDIDLQGVVSNGAITKTGAGLMRLSGAGANTYSGLTTVTAGTLLLDKTGVNAVGGNVLINGGTLTLNASDEIVDTAAMTITSGSFVMDTFSETLDSLTFQGGSMSQSSGVLTLSNAGAALTMRNTTIPGAVVLQASGAVIFDATNDGTATLNSTLDLGGGTVSFTIGDGAATTDMELQGVVSNGALTKLGTGQLLFSGGSANTYSGLTTVTAGSLVLSKTTGIDAIAGNVLIDGGTLTLNASAQINNASAMTITSGSFGMGTFSETLDSLTFQGGTLSQSGGVLSLANATTALTMRNTTIAGSVVLSSSGGVVFDATNNGTALLSGPLDLGSGTATFTIGNGTASTDMNLSGLVSNGALTKVGLGTLSLTGTGANTYSGVTTVTAGELLLNKTGVNAIAGDITVNGGTLTLGSADQIIDTSNLTLSSGTFDMGGFNETMGSFTFQAGTLTQGAGVLTLASGTTALTMRNTTISGAVVLSSSGSVVFDNTNNGTAILSGTLGLGGGTSTFDIADGAATTDMNVSGVISNGAISKIGAGQLAFSGASANTYTGLTSVTVGSLLLNKSSGVTSIPGDISVAGGTVTLGAANQIATTSTMTLSSGTFDMAGFAEVMGTLIYQGGTFTQGGAAVTLASASNALTMRNTTISGAVVLSGGGTVVFDNTNNGTAILSGTLNMSGSSTTFNIADGSAATDMNVSGTIANGAVTKTGAGTLAYSGGSANTYSGLTTVTAGTLDLNKTAGVDAIAGNVLINGGVVTLSASNEIIDTAAMTITSGTFAMGASSETIDNLTFQGGTLTQSGGTLTLANATTALTMRDTTIPGAVILSSSGAVVFDNTNNGTATLSGTLNLGGAATSFNIGDGTSATDMDISGVISNGSVTKIGAGALAFSGGSANTYTGLTTVTAGTLNLNKTAAVTAVPGNVLINGGTLSLSANSQIVNTATMTIISGAFDMGASSQTMSQLTFQGGTMSQSGGVLSLSHPVTALTMRSVTIPGGMTLTGGGSIVFDATNNGTASIDGPIDMGGSTISYNIGNGSAAIDMAISGIISNGAMTKIGTGLLYLTGANTYAGGTIVTAGSLMGNTTSLQGDISNSSTVIFTQNFDGTYADNLTGTGTLVLNGTGRVDFTGMCVQGSTQIVDGNLALNGTLNSPVLVDTSGTLSGNGIVTGSVNINGIVSPGNSIGILNVMGNVSQAAGSELDIEVNPTTADLFNITGSYTIQPGATLALFPDPGTYAPTTQYIIVDTTGGVIGTFSNVTVSLPSFSGEVIYHPSQILITFGTLPFIDIITNGNASKVAACVDAANQTGDMGFVVDELRMLNNTELYDAFDQMQPCIFKGAVVTQESNIDLIRTSLSRRMEECYQTKCNRYASIRAGATIWASANASRFTQMGVNSRAGHLVGYEGTTTSGTVGLDIAGGSHFTIGIAGAYSLTPLKFHADRGHAEIESAYAGFYTGVYGSLGYINISGLGSLNWYDESRKIEFAAIDRHATNRHMGRQALAHTDLGLIFPWAFLEFRPFGSGDFVWSEENHFKEKGAESLDLDVAKTRYQYLRGEVGLALSACLNTGKIKWIPDVKGSRVRELRHSGERYTCNFVDETCEFTVLGLYPTRDLWTYSVGFSFISPAESTTASIRYERQFNDTYNIESGIFQLMFRF